MINSDSNTQPSPSPSPARSLIVAAVSPFCTASSSPFLSIGSINRCPVPDFHSPFCSLFLAVLYHTLSYYCCSRTLPFHQVPLMSFLVPSQHGVAQQTPPDIPPVHNQTERSHLPLSSFSGYSHQDMPTPASSSMPTSFAADPTAHSLPRIGETRCCTSFNFILPFHIQSPPLSVRRTSDHVVFRHSILSGPFMLILHHTDWSLLSSDLHFIYLDPVFANHLEDQADLLIGKSLLNFVHPEEQASARADLTEALEQRTMHGTVTRSVSLPFSASP